MNAGSLKEVRTWEDEPKEADETLEPGGTGCINKISNLRRVLELRT